MKYIKKPIAIEAVQIPLKRPTGHEYYNWSKSAPAWIHAHAIWMNEEGFIIPTLEGNMLCAWGNWIIQGPQGEIYPIHNDIFLQTYEPVEED